MAINAEFHTEDDVLYVTASGRDDSIEDPLRYGASIIEQALIHQSKRILVDERELIYAISTFDLYETAKAMAENATQVVKAALVVNPAQVKDASFWETVAVNRGLDVHLFTDIDDAKKWLGINE